MSGLALPKGQPSHASINPSALSRPPKGPDDLGKKEEGGSGSGTAAGGSGSGSGKQVIASVPEITVVEGLVPTLQ
jgi:hypothetical protein